MSGKARTPFAAARKLARILAGISLATAAVGLASPALALTIKPTFDSSITSLANAKQIENDFNTVAKFYDANLASPVTVNIDVSWGSVDGVKMGSGALGSSYDNLYGYFTYDQLKGYLTSAAGGNAALATAVKSLPASDPGAAGQYAMAYAQAKALGAIPANQPGFDGYIGFSSAQPYDFNPTDGITSTTYDFESVAAHEIAEVLGRITGITGSSPVFLTTLDLFRYSAAGQRSLGFKSPAYFSLDSGSTSLGDFSYTSGDRSDWLVSTSGAKDAQAANAKKGVAYGISVADLTALDILGWAGSNVGDTKLSSPTLLAHSFMSAPEPATWALWLLGAAALGGELRRRRLGVRAAANA